MLIDSSINNKINLRVEFDVSDEGKELNNLKNVRRNNQITITNMTDEILNRDFRIDELKKKRELFSNDVSKIKRYKFKLKEILKDGRRFRNGVDFGLEDKYVQCFKRIILNEKPGLVLLNKIELIVED